MSAAGVHPLRSFALISRGVFIELARKKDAYVLMIFMLLFVVGMVAAKAVGIDSPSTGTFLLNLGISLVYIFSHTITLLLAFNQIPREIEHRSIYPLLARPLSRSMYVFSKCGACALCGFLVYVVLFVLGWLPVPKLETYHVSMLLQMMALHFGSLFMISALAVACSLFMARGVNLILLAVWFLFGGKLVTFLAGRTSSSGQEKLVEWFLAYLPNFEKLNLVTRYTDGIGALSAGDFFGLVGYLLVISGFALAVSMRTFERRPI
jgi:Cu-processing system permease protein